MEEAKFAIPLDDNSIQSGEITFKQLVDNGEAVTFQLTDVKDGTGDQLNLKTIASGKQVDHIFDISISDGTASVEVSTNDMIKVLADADGVDWDYVEADWTTGEVDTPDPSYMFSIQAAQPYDMNFWPPKPKQ